MHQTEQLESLSQDHTQGRTLKQACRITESTCFITWMCSGLRHSRDSMSHKPGTTHTSQHSCARRAEAEPAHCSILQDKQDPFPGCDHSSFPTLTPPAIPQPVRTQAFCYRPLWEIITLQFAPSDAAKSIQLKNALHRATERGPSTAGPGSSQFALQLHTEVLCIYSFPVLVGRDQPCLINLPCTS